MLRKLFVTALVLAGGLFADHPIAVGDSAGKSPAGEPAAEGPPRVQFGTFLVQAVGARVKMAWQISGDGSVSGFRIYRREITDSEEIDSMTGRLSEVFRAGSLLDREGHHCRPGTLANLPPRDSD
ncbi:MAG: hypothetical protein O7D32_04560 [bacterium]|nr:hypothetical protein [bacterium]